MTLFSPLPKIILASASPRRRELLHMLGLDIEIIPSSYSEPALPQASAEQLVFIHALEKARDVAASYPGRIVLGADTIVELDGTIFGKPKDAAEARTTLARLAGRTHTVHTGFALVRDRQCVADTCRATVEMYALTPEDISAYVATGEPLDKAGAYGIQGKGAVNIVGVQGDYFTVVGLPLAKVRRALQAFAASA